MVRTLLLLVLLVPHALLQAQLFGPQIDVTMSAPDPSVVDAADMNGDGRVDIITACRDGKVCWFPQDDMFNFGLLQLITLLDSTGTPQLVVADLDGDGDPDVLSASDHDNRIFLNMNLGGGAFGPQQVITDLADGVSCLAVTDVDGDGDTDLLSASVNDDKLAWYANDGSGNFGAQLVISATVDHISHVTTADLDGDGDQDIIMVSWTAVAPWNWTSDIRWLANNGSGSFDAAQTIASSLSRVDQAAVGDIDGDSDTDILYLDQLNGTILQIHTNDSDGNFTQTTSLPLENIDGTRIQLSDLDNDSDLDIVCGIYTMIILENDGLGGLVESWSYEQSSGTFTYVTKDLNSDGRKDLLASLINLGFIQWWPNEAYFNFGDPIGITQLVFPTSLQAIDIDNDLDLDLIYANDFDWIENNGIRWHVNASNFIVQQIYQLIEYNGACTYLAINDIDSDGDHDIIDCLGNKLINNGQDGFTGPFEIPGFFSFSAPVTVELVDLDADGDLDLRTGTSWRANDGSGVFGSELWNSQSGWLRRSISLDIDGDGDVDIAGIASGDSSIAWVENDGSGGFGAQQLITDLVDGAACIAAADLDGDGDLDLLSASFNDGVLAWYANSGQGDFGPQQLITILSGAWCIATGDLDGDGDVDVVAGDFFDGKVVWMANMGTGEFGPQEFINNRRWNSPVTDYHIYSERSLICADLDGDGDLDVATSSAARESKVAWHENRSNTIGIASVQANTLTLYPNPMTNSTTVVLDQAGGTVLVELLDVQGRTVRAQRQPVKDHQLTITREGLQRGQYLLRITGAERAEGKLMVE